MSSTILLRDAVGDEFKTSNSSVITSVIEMMKRTLNGKVKEVEEKSAFEEKGARSEGTEKVL